jgi:cytochrome c oxidase subunit 3
MADAAPHVAEHFEDLPRQAHAARLGMWVFLASEVLFFGGLFALYTAARVEHPIAFGEGVRENAVVWGSVNTAVLLCSSYSVALAVHFLRAGRTRAAEWLLVVTIALAGCFLAIKGHEYWMHFHEGIFPGGHGAYFTTHREPGLPMFFTLYFCMTGLHALHVIVGMGVLGVLLAKVARRRIVPAAAPPLAIGAVYWHLVDVVWIFLWPLFYLIVGESR